MSDWSDTYEGATMGAWTVVDDIGQAEVAAKGKTLAAIRELPLRDLPGVIQFEFSDGTIIEVHSPDLMILEVGYAAKPR